MKAFYPDSTLEKKYLEGGYSYVIGVDEVGRGSWAGPLVVGAYVYRIESKIIPGVNDSKLLTSRKRLLLSQKLIAGLARTEIGPIYEIDKYNIAEATRRAIIRTVEKLNLKNAFVLIDGYFKKGFDFEHECIVKGDQKHYSISAASIIAKVYRDNLMQKFATDYPGYGFGTNVGYGTRGHLMALKRLGICDIHRKSFNPMKAMT